jgi:hypothetical protein
MREAHTDLSLPAGGQYYLSVCRKEPFFNPVLCLLGKPFAKSWTYFVDAFTRVTSDLPDMLHSRVITAHLLLLLARNLFQLVATFRQLLFGYQLASLHASDYEQLEARHITPGFVMTIF